MADRRLFIPFFDLLDASDPGRLTATRPEASRSADELQLTPLELAMAAAIVSPSYYQALINLPDHSSPAAALFHFAAEGIHADIAPSPLFIPSVYAERLAAAGVTLPAGQPASFFHWLRVGLSHRIVPTHFFDETYYQRTYPDVSAAGVFGFAHFLAFGIHEGRSPNGRRDVVAEFSAFAGHAAGSRSNALDSFVQHHLLDPEGYDPVCDVSEEATDIGDEPAAITGYSLPWRWCAGGIGPVTFPGDPLGDYYDDLSFDQAEILGWVKLVKSCWPAGEDWERLRMISQQVRDSDAFDETYYTSRNDLPATADPAMHYVLIGDALGFAPSTEFDPRYYASRYRDVAASGMNLLLHYVEYGRNEGRFGLPPVVQTVNPKCFDPARENVIVVAHETSRTGAPILAWNIVRHLSERYNVYTVCIGGGALTSEFDTISAERFGPFHPHRQQAADLRGGLQALFSGRTFAYAIINSCEARPILEICAEHLVPTLFLMHEFASYVHPASSLRRAFDAASSIVFSAPIIARAAQVVHPPLLNRRIEILPQGMSVIPSSGEPSRVASAQTDKKPGAKPLQALQRAHENGTFMVLGAGTVEFRKGVDLFLGTAAAVLRHSPARSVHFVWVGRNYRPDVDVGYSVYLREQMQRSGLESHVTILDEVSDLEPIYALADAFLLASRLDPLPNVCIDAAVRRIPIVCFHDASGMADLMMADPATATAVVPYLDSDAAGQLIARFASDEPARQKMAEAISDLARRHFDMESYVSRLDQLGLGLAPMMAQRRADFETLNNDASFDQDLFLGGEAILESREHSIARYLAHVTTRRASPGFNPDIWNALNPATDLVAPVADPLAQFVRAGRPAGPWQMTVLRPRAIEPSLSGTRAILHVATNGTAESDEFLTHVLPDQAGIEVRVTVEPQEAADMLERSSPEGSGMTMTVGKATLGALLREIASLDDDVIIGRLRMDASDVDQGSGEFHWQALIGPRHAMAHRILAAFDEDRSLGLVFPAYPHWPDCDDHKVGQAMEHYGYESELPGDYPQAGMFWARRAVLANLAEHVGDREAVSDETLVQLLPLATRSLELNCAVSHVPGVFW